MTGDLIDKNDSRNFVQSFFNHLLENQTANDRDVKFGHNISK